MSGAIVVGSMPHEVFLAAELMNAKRLMPVKETRYLTNVNDSDPEDIRTWFSDCTAVYVLGTYISKESAMQLKKPIFVVKDREAARQRYWPGCQVLQWDEIEKCDITQAFIDRHENNSTHMTLAVLAALAKGFYETVMEADVMQDIVLFAKHSMDNGTNEETIKAWIKLGNTYAARDARLIQQRINSGQCVAFVFEDHQALALPCNEFVQDTKNALAALAPIGVVFMLACKDGVYGYDIKLQTLDPELNVGAIAAKYGGGGSKNNSGFHATMPLAHILLPFLAINPPRMSRLVQQYYPHLGHAVIS
jgi:hypothetical protein